MIKAILFDLDNTLIDFLTFKKETAKAAAKAMVTQGFPLNEIETYGKIFSVYDEKGIEYQKTFVFNYPQPWNHYFKSLVSIFPWSVVLILVELAKKLS